MRNSGMRRTAAVLIVSLGVSMPHVRAAETPSPAKEGYIRHQLVEREGSEPLHEIRTLDRDGEVLAVSYYDELKRRFMIQMESLPFDVEFPGGSAAELAETVARGYREALQRLPGPIRESIPEITVTTVVPADIGAVQIPPVSLRGITIGAVQIAPFSLRGITSIGGATRPWLPAGLGLSLWVHDDRDIARAEIWLSGTRTWAVYSLRDALVDCSIEDVLSLLETAWRMQAETLAAEVKYHEPTETLHILATPQEITMASLVFAALPQVDSPQGAGELEALRQDVQAIREVLKQGVEREGK